MVKKVFSAGFNERGLPCEVSEKSASEPLTKDKKLLEKASAKPLTKDDLFFCDCDGAKEKNLRLKTLKSALDYYFSLPKEYSLMGRSHPLYPDVSNSDDDYELWKLKKSFPAIYEQGDEVEK